MLTITGKGADRMTQKYWRGCLIALCAMVLALAAATLWLLGRLAQTRQALDRALAAQAVSPPGTAASPLPRDDPQAADQQAAIQAALDRQAAEQEAYLAQFKRYKNILTQDQVEQTLFGQPVSAQRNGEYRIGVKTADDGDWHAVLTLYQVQEGRYVPLLVCPAVIGRNGAGKQAEGDGKTPLGTWQVGQAYGILEDPGCTLPYTRITEDLYWCATGANGLWYNRLISAADDPEGDRSEDEHLIDFGPCYHYLLDLGYNAAGVPYAGNAIFLHCWASPDGPTSGCVAIAESDLEQILTAITPGTTITIY